MRLPLQTGAGALRDLLAAGVLGTLLLLVTCTLMGGMAAAVMSLELTATIVCWGVSAACGAQAIRTLAGGISSAQTHRASDLVVQPYGIQIVGGRRHGLDVLWERIDAKRCSVEPAITGTSLAFVGGARYRQALFIAVDGDAIAVAESADEAEDQALEGAFAAIRRGCGVHADAPSGGPGAPRGITCASCGAPTAIDDVPSMPCAFCGQAVTVPEELRRRIREAREHAALSTEVERAVERILDQPGADRTNLVIVLAGTAGGAAMLATMTAPLFVIALHANLASTAMGALAGLSLTAGLILLAHAFVSDRCGLRALMLGFTAKPSAAGADCRRCSAPLPAQHASGSRPPLVARCVYCGVDNILAPGVERDVADVRSVNVELRDAVQTLRRTKGLFALGVLACLGLAAVAGTASTLH